MRICFCGHDWHIYEITFDGVKTHHVRARKVLNAGDREKLDAKDTLHVPMTLERLQEATLMYARKYEQH